MSQARTASTEALVLKRFNSGETDRVVTLLGKDRGKFVCIAKGVRSLTSSKRAMLEPGNHIKCHLVLTKGMPILTQAAMITDCAVIHSQLPKIRQLMQLLEIVDRLFVEEEPEAFIFSDVLSIREQIVSNQPTPASVLQQLGTLIEHLGYQPLAETSYSSATEYVAAIADRPLKSWEYLKVRDTGET